MSRPFTPLQAHQNEMFLDSLARSGNVRLSARAAGVGYGTIQHRRSAHADFAQRWEATVAAVDARLHLAGGRRGPEADVIASGAKRSRKARGGDAEAGLPRRCAPRNDAYRTQGGEPVVVRTRNGKLQVRLAHPGKLTLEAEQAFLHALSATANVRLSAAAAGASPAAFYRRRKLDPVFAREFRLALKMGWERLEAAAVAAGLAGSHSRDRWRQCAPAPIPPLSFDQAFQLLCLHDRSVNQGWEKPHRRRRRGESDETHPDPARGDVDGREEGRGRGRGASPGGALRGERELALRGRGAAAGACPARAGHRLVEGERRRRAARQARLVRRLADRGDGEGAAARLRPALAPGGITGRAPAGNPAALERYPGDPEKSAASGGARRRAARAAPPAAGRTGTGG
jgi:hypothetical protein